jgi:hypothetical protein
VNTTSILKDFMISIPSDNFIDHINQIHVKSIEHIRQTTTKSGTDEIDQTHASSNHKSGAKQIDQTHPSNNHKNSMIKWIKHTRQTITKVGPIK